MQNNIFTNRVIFRTLRIFFSVIISIFIIIFLNDRYGRIGMASWYGESFGGKLTASGKLYDPNKFTAAHRKLQFGTKLKIINLCNFKSVEVEVTDRGPYVWGRIIDLSYATAKELDIVNKGTGLILFLNNT